jgi:hypothetical protein
VIDHGEGTHFSTQLLHATTGGAPFATTVPFGADPSFVLSPQGVLPISVLSGQRQTIARTRRRRGNRPRFGMRQCPPSIPELRHPPTTVWSVRDLLEGLVAASAVTESRRLGRDARLRYRP